LTLGDGEDGPEDYARALFETAWIGWRPGAKHIVVLFGDAPAHDTEFYMPAFGLNFGVDPGTDAEAGTDDDLSFTEVVDLLVQREIEVIPINSDLEGLDIVQAGFEYVASQTGGQVYPINAATEVADAVVEGVGQATMIIREMKVVPDPQYQDWVTITPPAFNDVGGGETHTFGIDLLVPADAEPGAHTFNLTVVGDGATLGQVPVILNIAPPEIDVEQLLADKDRLMGFLCAPEAPIKVLGVTVSTFHPSEDRDTYCVQEAAVGPWVQDLKAKHTSGELEPASALALAGLQLQEQGFRDLWLHQVKAANIIGEHLGHVIGVVWSMVNVVKFLDHVDSKHTVGLLVTKIKNIVMSKIMGAFNSFARWMLDSLPPSPERDNLKAALNVLQQFTDKAFEDALKKKMDFGAVLERLVVEGLLSITTTTFLNTRYVQATQGEITRGLKEAQGTAAQSMEPGTASRLARQRANEVNAALGRAQGETNSLASYSEDVQRTQDAGKVVAEAADAISLVAALPGPVQIIGAFARLVAIGERLIDVGLSGTVVARAVGTRSVTRGASEDVTNLAFGLPASSAAVAPGPSRPGLIHRASLIPPEELAGGPSLSPAARARLERAQQASTDYQALLAQLTATIQAGQTDQAKTLTEALITADEALNAELLSARAPIFAGASTLLERGDTTFSEDYEQFGQSAVDYDLEGALLYVQLLGYLAQPEDATLRQAALDQIETVSTALDDYVSDVEETLPLVHEFTDTPVVIVASYSAPPATVGAPFDLLLELRNPGATDAGNATVTAIVGDTAELLSPSTVQLDRIPADGTTEASFRLRLTGPQAVIRVDTTTENGEESFRYIALSATTGGGGIPTPLILVLVAGVVAGGVVILASRRAGPRIPPGTGFQVTPPGAAPRFVRMRRSPFTIGRHPRCDVTLPDRRVSSRHAQVRWEAGQFVLYDLNSVNGTFVNDEQVQQAFLQPGDRIRVGNTELIFHTGRPRLQRQAAARRAELVVQAGPAAGTRYPLRGAVTTLGRHASNDIALPQDPKASTRHAEIRQEGTQFVIYDLNSTNGTFVNDQRIQRHLLRPGDIVRVGQTELTFRA